MSGEREDAGSSRLQPTPVAPSRGGEGECPVRVQLSRAKGWRLPPNTVIVSRPSKCGNPFNWLEARREWGCTEAEAKAAAAMLYRDWLTMTEPERFPPYLRARRVAILASFPELRGNNVACWCKLGEPCHADVLLELANAPPTPPPPDPQVPDDRSRDAIETKPGDVT